MERTRLDDKGLLQEQLAERREIRNARLKRKYRLARELGFTAEEAAVMQSWGEQRVRSLAQELIGGRS